MNNSFLLLIFNALIILVLIFKVAVHVSLKPILSSQLLLVI